MVRVNLDDRIAEINNRFAALVGDIRLAHALNADALIAEMKKWHELQLKNLVADARLDEARRITERIKAIPKSSAP
jgi:hypothetical protein